MSSFNFILSILLSFSAVTFAGNEKGKRIYNDKCKNCHGNKGEGIAPAIPPLADSDFLRDNKETSIKALLEGLQGEITVNHKKYNALMPMVPLKDEDVAHVLNFLRTEWNGLKDEIKVEEVAALRAKSKYKTYEKQVAAALNIPLPKAPEGWKVELKSDLPFNPTRMLNFSESEILILTTKGSIYHMDLVSSKMKLVLDSKDYLLFDKPNNGGTQGFCLDDERRLYVTSGYHDDTQEPHDISRAWIYRSAPIPKKVAGSLPKPKPWFKANLPAGVGPYNHGLSNIAQGPDGWMYVSSGSRTNSGEPGKSKRRSKIGEHPLTASMWRLKDDTNGGIDFQIFARGLRNPYGFCWDEKGNLFATENGPDKDLCAELNIIKENNHYGFPHKFSDLEENPHDFVPPHNPNIEFTKPLINLGPDGNTALEGKEKQLATFTAHCVPTGIVHLGDDFPEGWKNKMLVCRFGGFWRINGIETGFDILKVNLAEGREDAIEAHTVLSKVARPIDIKTARVNGKPTIVIAEFCHGNTMEHGWGHPGRIIVMYPE
ncbi:MAG: PQQ-dependent sugar dehydrogenase [Lentisphaeraceae bacterium]|nr:PQQ-dependent sugar dehydrogenase [Lentisphaeraceae bacterium]